MSDGFDLTHQSTLTRQRESLHVVREEVETIVFGGEGRRRKRKRCPKQGRIGWCPLTTVLGKETIVSSNNKATMTSTDLALALD